MSTAARRDAIVERAVRDGYVEAHTLALELGVNASTIRRDLDVLERAGHVRRTHGGARLLADGTGDIPYARKQTANLAAKTEIAEAAAALVSDGEAVILDSGSTTYQVAVALRGKPLTIITNDLRIAKFVATDPAARLLVTGGELLGTVFTLVGGKAASFLSELRADWTFLGADAVSLDGGITNTNTIEVPIKRAMIAAAQHPIALADSSKIDRRVLARVAGLDEVEAVLTDTSVDADAVARYRPHLRVARA
ncbi:DeoR/GlpR family DNA-binding transcription regulator [Longivirga aurantiaca]|uniref:Lactose phosphotransferase system repressor n=1 Tax=Longivirga aurantiaca TaxID=1837743 RepID=A0ABW1SXE8_9ACTN